MSTTILDHTKRKTMVAVTISTRNEYEYNNIRPHKTQNNGGCHHFHEIKLRVQGLRYNGVIATTTPETTMKYEWSVDKTGNIKELEQKVTVGETEVEAHYNAKKNVTEIKKKLEGKKYGNHRDGDGNKIEKKEILPGMVILDLVTKNREMVVSY
ncbi:MAG: hypothetical protein M0P64_02625 [Candidatus Pacebacteria bacterium]|jgi:hypothetical protein|nr:hypothetical protein [Candidatus Paceibacterota bacterium]